MTQKTAQTRFKGFTLSELLIALAILGVIATFTIPKVLQSQQDTKYKAIAKEAAAAVSEAYLLYKTTNVPPTTMRSEDLKPFINYLKVDTVSIIDSMQTQGTYDCSIGTRCVKLHNGAMLWFVGGAFNGTGSTNAIWFLVDPDGKETVSGSTTEGKGVEFALYYNGKLRTLGTLDTPTCDSGGCGYVPSPTYDPPWFSWD